MFVFIFGSLVFLLNVFYRFVLERFCVFGLLYVGCFVFWLKLFWVDGYWWVNGGEGV